MTYSILETDERIVDILAEIGISMDSTVNCGVFSQKLVIFFGHGSRHLDGFLLQSLGSHSFGTEI